MRPQVRGWIVGLALLLGNIGGVCQLPAAPPVKASPDEDLGIVKAEPRIGRASIVRGFWASDDLKYDASGRPIDPGTATDWTLCGFDLEKVRRRIDGDLQLDGVRVAVRSNPDQRIFERHLLKMETTRIVFPAPERAGRRAGAGSDAPLISKLIHYAVATYLIAVASFYGFEKRFIDLKGRLAPEKRFAEVAS